MPKSILEQARIKHFGEAADKRRKIPTSEHPRIKALRNEGWSWRKLAALYEVDKRLIQFIVHPERLLASRAHRDWREYYTAEKNREYIRKYRAHKRALLIENNISLCRLDTSKTQRSCVDTAKN